MVQSTEKASCQLSSSEGGGAVGRIAAAAELVWLGKMVIWYPGGQHSLDDRGNLFSNCQQQQLHCQRHHKRQDRLYGEEKKIVQF